MTTISSDTDLNERIKQAIQKFETIQQTSNIKWLQQQVLACQGLDPILDGYDKRHDELKICGKHTFYSWKVTYLIILDKRREDLAKKLHFDSWDALAAHHDIASVDELLAIDIGQYDKGTHPPVPTDRRLVFLDELHTTINSDFDHDAPSYAPLDLPSDYCILLSYSDGLADTDLRNSHECGINNISSCNTASMTGYSPDNVQKGLYNTDDLPWCNDLSIRYGWEVSTGFLLGGKTYREDQNWLAYYYCCRTDPLTRLTLNNYPGRVDTITEHQTEWKWRVFYNQPERFQHSFLHPMIFSDLIEWMEFHGDWWQRESVDYPAWMEGRTADLELHGPKPDDGSEDEDENEKEVEEEEQEMDYDVNLFET